MSIFSHPAAKRKITCILMGIGFGFLCAYLASQGVEGEDFWWTPVMWNIVFNRMLLGFVIYIIGVYNFIPLFNKKYSAWIRGAAIGAMVSLDIAIGSFTSPFIAPSEAINIFWMTILAGAVYGLIIDAVATALFGDGQKLTKGWSK